MVGVVGYEFYPEAPWGASHDAAKQCTRGGKLQWVGVVVAVLLAFLVLGIELFFVGTVCQIFVLLVAWSSSGGLVWGEIWVIFARIFLRGRFGAFIRLVS